VNDADLVPKLGAPQLDAPEAAPEPTACERCGNFADLDNYDAQQICDACIARLSELERDPPTVGNLLSGSVWVLSRIGLLAALVVALADLPIVVIEVFFPESPTFLSTVWGMTVSIVAQGTVFHLAQRAIRGEELSLPASMRTSLEAASRLVIINALAGFQIFFFLLLLIVPGVMRALSLVLILPIIVNEADGGKDAIARSLARMSGHRVTALLAYAVWGVLWVGGLSAYLGFSLALDTTALGQAPTELVSAVLLVAGLLLPVLMVPTMCVTAVLYAKTLRLREPAHRPQTVQDALDLDD